LAPCIAFMWSPRARLLRYSSGIPSPCEITW
jgi:hypothetical protein